MAPRKEIEAMPESDQFGEAPHPRDTLSLSGHQEAEVQLLDAYRSGRLPHAWILGGKQGIGKATLAWRFARFLFVNADPAAPQVVSAMDLSVPPDHPMVRRMNARALSDISTIRPEWDAKGKKFFTGIRVDDVRRTLQMFQQAASAGGWRVAILDSAEDLNSASANALLKVIEEPPPKSLFLIVAHRPSQIIPTIRSRCRKLLLNPLSVAEVTRALQGVDEVWSAHDEGDLRAAAERSGGSVQEALKLLDGEALALLREVSRHLEHLPRVEWLAIHRLAEKLSSRDATADFETVLAAVFDWLDHQVRAGGQQRPEALAPYAEAWEKIRAQARETEALNLDRRPLILSIFTDLAAAKAA
ncbi:DNA polymerase III subunit delta' [Methylovirgula sp. 4M-Z18]|uniref:DNA polymerase III subunit delta' n=1 Tax=Methylovirgula sp. 4M-Z18 TaxID=2293567 RepID=UPI000E2F361F|nr:DNA polymerase III subunit delta' [Methylovirgula sp. 4M-Z18]RFB80545.1 DNA polymerase III subunit delta' [Methylovirgula sp. 4M-Z18]